MHNPPPLTPLPSFLAADSPSRASELSCSYSSETRWQQKGKSSTEARLRPRS